MSRRVGRGRKRKQARGRRGRFVRNTLENTFGLSAPVCAACRGFNPIEAGAPLPERCQQCGAAPFVALTPEMNRRGAEPADDTTPPPDQENTP